MTTLDVTLPHDAYQVIIEPGALERLGSEVQRVAPHKRALLAVDERILADHGAIARQSLADAGIEVTVVTLEALETQKTMASVQRLHDAMLADHLERRSPVIALGGGIVGDVAGFAAATYLRGVPLIQVPTTLLAMVDAAIGGKTGVNTTLPEGGLGKNLIGAFWQPRLVLADPLVLKTLDERDFRCGLAETVKHGLISNVDLLTAIAEKLDAINARDAQVLTSLIAVSAGVKIAIVQEDERESGRRALLNLGHTFAHVIEPLPELDLRHGEAVAIGLCAACACSRDTGRLDEEDGQLVTDLLDMLQLPTRLPSPVALGPLVAAMRHDKKVIDDVIRLILPRGLGAAEIVSDVDTEVVERAWRDIGATR